MLNRSTAHLVAATVIASALLAGCGTQTGFNHVGRPATSAPHARAMDAGSSAAVAGIKALQASMTSCSGSGTFWESDEKGNTQTNTMNVTWAAPEKLRVDITASSDGMRDGATLVYMGGSSITAKKFFIHQTFSVTDPKALSLRGFRIDQIDIKGLLNTLTNPANTMAAGTAPNVYEVTGAGILPTTTREEVTLDPKTFVPQKLEFFNGTTSVYRVHLTSVKINPTIDPSVFQI